MYPTCNVGMTLTMDDGYSVHVSCSQPAGHPGDHSASVGLVYWSQSPQYQ